jgi:hypothetical protein
MAVINVLRAHDRADNLQANAETYANPSRPLEEIQAHGDGDEDKEAEEEVTRLFAHGTP